MSVTHCGSAFALSARVVARSVAGRSRHIPVCRLSTPRPSAVTAGVGMFSCEERGAPYSPDYRIYFRDAEGPISPLHDVPLYHDEAAGIVNMIVEIPRWSNAKMEISLSEPLNPVKQDVKKGALRFVHNVFPHRGYIWNYGALPQTWEDPQHVDAATGTRGDNDPIDVLEIGDRVAHRGEVIQVKIIGALAFIDEGETDWKLLAIDVRDTLSQKLNGPADIEREKPGLLRATAEWLTLYKVPAGGAKGADPGPPIAAAKAMEVVALTHASWRTLHSSGATKGINLQSVSTPGSGHISRQAAADIVASAPIYMKAQTIPESVDKWHYLANL